MSWCRGWTVRRWPSPAWILVAGALPERKEEAPTTIRYPVLVEACSPAFYFELIPVCVGRNQLGDVVPGLVEKAGEATILFLQRK